MRQLLTTPGQAGEILRAQRKSRKLGQQELATKLGISQSRLSSLETDPAGLTLERFLALAHLLGLELVLQEKERARGSKAEW